MFNKKYAENKWKILEHAIHEIFNHKAASLSFEELHRHAYHMVVNEHGERLYVRLVTTMTSHVKEISKFIIETVEVEGELFLEELNWKWNDYCNSLQMIGDILMYMDKAYVRTEKKTPVKDLGLNLWRDIVVHSRQVKSLLLKTLPELVHRDRIGEVINRDLTRDTIKMLMDLGPSVYETLFESPFHEISAEFYRAESLKLIDCCDCGDYLKKTEKLLNEEIDRVSYFINASSQQRIVNNVVKKEMIANHMLTLIHMEDSGLVDMLVGHRYEDLKRMYNLFGNVPDGRIKIQQVMISHVRETVKQFTIKIVEDREVFVERLSEEIDKYGTIVKLAFNNDEKFHNELKSLLEYFTKNMDPVAPDFVLLIMEYMMKKGLKGISEEVLERILPNMKMFIQFLKGKELVPKYSYKQNMLVSEDLMEDVLWSVEVKSKCKELFISRVQTMYSDINTSKSMSRGFYKSHPELCDGPTLTVQVLTPDIWPSSRPTESCNLPDEVSALCEKYQSYYIGNQPNRKLSWQTNLGTAEMIATFGKGQKHELHVSTFQMCVMMLFNNADQLSYKEIQKATKIPASDLKRCLHSMTLVEGKNVMRKEPMSVYIGQDDTFSVNDNFSRKFYKVKMGTVITKEKADTLEAQQRMEERRKSHIDAAIVRIMKSMKQLDHDSLISEVTKKLEPKIFLANPTEITNRIESLIERDCLERDQIDTTLYRYIA